MQLTEVVTRKTAREFLKVPRIIYKEDKNWISPLDKDVEATFDPAKNPLFKTGEVTRWVLRDGSGRLIGRVAAFVNQQLAYTFKQPTGGIGFLSASTTGRRHSCCLTGAGNGCRKGGWRPWTDP
jgi:hypothetical protein